MTMSWPCSPDSGRVGIRTSQYRPYPNTGEKTHQEAPIPGTETTLSIVLGSNVVVALRLTFNAERARTQNVQKFETEDRTCRFIEEAKEEGKEIYRSWLFSQRLGRESVERVQNRI